MTLFTEPREIAPGAVLLPGFAMPAALGLRDGIRGIAKEAPFRRMTTPGGLPMSVSMTNCGPLGWVTDRAGYRYSAVDPESGRAWPPMPEPFHGLAQSAAVAAGFPNFAPDACLINRYAPGAKMSPHQDKDERDLEQPIVSVSLGLPAVFQFGGLQRSAPLERIPLEDGDVVVWGGPARLRYHGILPLKPGDHPVFGPYRYNLTFRQAA
jgi:DNA oxidative demethylase